VTSLDPGSGSRPTLDAGSPALLAQALLLGERIDLAALELRDPVCAAPLAFRVGEGLAVVFRYGVVVLVGMDPAGEAQILQSVLPCVHGRLQEREEETVRLSLREGDEEGVGADGVVHIGPPALEKLLLVADALAKSAALAQNERHIAEVFDTVEPWARRLAVAGRTLGGRRPMIRLIGSALLVQHRLSERVAFAEKPDILWDHPGLERLYARLETEFELVERGETLARKLELVGESVSVMTDLIDTQRAFRLEAIVALLIVVELGLSLLGIARG